MPQRGPHGSYPGKRLLGGAPGIPGRAGIWTRRARGAREAKQPARAPELEAAGDGDVRGGRTRGRGRREGGATQ
eukprot:3478498-Pyramimonas_sp.AAC.1